MTVIRIFFIYIGQSIKIPPAFIIVWPILEAIPRIIGGVFALIGSGSRITAFPIKINAVAAGMIEDAINNYMNPKLFGFSAKGAKVILIAEERVDFFVICCVVAMIGMSLKNWV